MVQIFLIMKKEALFQSHISNSFRAMKMKSNANSIEPGSRKRYKNRPGGRKKNPAISDGTFQLKRIVLST